MPALLLSNICRSGVSCKLLAQVRGCVCLLDFSDGVTKGKVIDSIGLLQYLHNH